MATGAGPVVWWLRNDLRIKDNPVVRQAVSAAVTDGRAGAAVFVFDPRFIDVSNYGRVTDPQFKKSIYNRKTVDFGNRKCGAVRARFWLQCVRAVGDELAQHGAKLLVCHGLPEEVFGALPKESLVVCQEEPVSPEFTDVEDAVEQAMAKNGSVLQREWGAMSLYHRDDLPFSLNEWSAPGSYTELSYALGWENIWESEERTSYVTPVRSPLPAPAVFPFKSAIELPNLISPGVLADDAAALKHLGYSDEEIRHAMGEPLPDGGEPAAQTLFERWLVDQENIGDNPQQGGAVFWDLPVGSGPGDGHDALQWTNLSKPDGWMRISHYMAVGCISAREMFCRSRACKNFMGVAHRLMWREFHRTRAIVWGRRLFWLQGPGKVERPWSWDKGIIDAWSKGRTGVPYIDACMRELRQTGWLAYKGRKTAGYFLVFGLGVDWRVGAYIFEELLLDYDVAMNYGNWVVVADVDKWERGEWTTWAYSVDKITEWSIPNIELKLAAEMANDPAGAYIRRWLPELRGLDDKFIHSPWLMSEEEMTRSGCVLGQDYPAPLLSPLEFAGTATGKKEAANFSESKVEATQEERRVHPMDPSGTAYTREEFNAWAESLEEYAMQSEKLWQESVSPEVSAAEKAELEELKAELAAKDREISELKARRKLQETMGA